MIDLYISSRVETSTRELAKIIKTECQISENISVVKDGAIETGYHIRLIDFDRKEFKKKIWEPLQELLKLQCAFVKEENQYMGCTRNWPSVFVQSQCAASPVDGEAPCFLKKCISLTEVPVTKPSSLVSCQRAGMDCPQD